MSNITVLEDFNDWSGYLESLLQYESYTVSVVKGDGRIVLELGVSAVEKFIFQVKNDLVELSINDEVVASGEKLMNLYREQVSPYRNRYLDELITMSLEEFLGFVTNKLPLLNTVSDVVSQFSYDLGASHRSLTGSVIVDDSGFDLTVTMHFKDTSDNITKKVHFDSRSEFYQSIEALNRCFVSNSDMAHWYAKMWFDLVDTKFENGKRVPR